METKQALNTVPGKLMYVAHSGQGKTNKMSGQQEFTATLRLSGQEAANLRAQIESFYNTHHQSNQHLSLRSLKIREVTDKATGQPTGETDFSFSNVVSGVNRSTGEQYTRTIGIFNAQTAEITPMWKDKNIGNGSIGCIGGVMSYYTHGMNDGVSLYLQNIQLINPQEYKQDSGFGAHEGGYVGEQEETGFAPQGDVATAPVQGMTPMAETNNPVQAQPQMAQTVPATQAPAPQPMDTVATQAPINFGAPQAPVNTAPQVQAQPQMAQTVPATQAPAPQPMVQATTQPAQPQPMQGQTYVANTGASRI